MCPKHVCVGMPKPSSIPLPSVIYNTSAGGRSNLSIGISSKVRHKYFNANSATMWGCVQKPWQMEANIANLWLLAILAVCTSESWHIWSVTTDYQLLLSSGVVPIVLRRQWYSLFLRSSLLISANWKSGKGLIHIWLKYPAETGTGATQCRAGPREVVKPSMEKSFASSQLSKATKGSRDNMPSEVLEAVHDPFICIRIFLAELALEFTGPQKEFARPFCLTTGVNLQKLHDSVEVRTAGHLCQSARHNTTPLVAWV